MQVSVRPRVRCWSVYMQMRAIELEFENFPGRHGCDVVHTKPMKWF